VYTRWMFLGREEEKKDTETFTFLGSPEWWRWDISVPRAHTYKFVFFFWYFSYFSFSSSLVCTFVDCAHSIYLHTHTHIDKISSSVINTSVPSVCVWWLPYKLDATTRISEREREKGPLMDADVFLFFPDLEIASVW
jgi:hypothetical protein